MQAAMSDVPVVIRHAAHQPQRFSQSPAEHC
jgi:hypothetical protein